jgi:polyphosphate glucokinase
MVILGIDVGGSGIKGAPVDVETGTLVEHRFRIATPQPSQPEAVAGGVAAVAEHFAWRGPIGCTFPAVIKHGVAWSAANVDSSWIGTNGQELFAQATGCPVVLLNDADAAGLAEMRFGAGRDRMGVVMVLTFGTGIGSAVFLDGKLLPNTELGHLEVRGRDAEHRASEAARERKKLSWKAWAVHVSEYLGVLEKLFSPDLFIFGGGVSRKHEKFFAYLHTRAEIVPAQLLNNAGIVGAALAVAHPELLAGSIYQEKLSV